MCESQEDDISCANRKGQDGFEILFVFDCFFNAQYVYVRGEVKLLTTSYPCKPSRLSVILGKLDEGVKINISA